MVNHSYSPLLKDILISRPRGNAYSYKHGYHLFLEFRSMPEFYTSEFINNLPDIVKILDRFRISQDNPSGSCPQLTGGEVNKILAVLGSGIIHADPGQFFHDNYILLSSVLETFFKVMGYTSLADIADPTSPGPITPDSLEASLISMEDLPLCLKHAVFAPDKDIDDIDEIVEESINGELKAIREAVGLVINP